jgi:hypothetical protein
LDLNRSGFANGRGGLGGGARNKISGMLGGYRFALQSYLRHPLIPVDDRNHRLKPADRRHIDLFLQTSDRLLLTCEYRGSDSLSTDQSLDVVVVENHQVSG